MSMKLDIPLRTLENWRAGKKCADYIKRYVLADLRGRG